MVEKCNLENCFINKGCVENCINPVYVFQTAKNFDAEKMLYNSEEKQHGADGAKTNATQQTATIQYV